MDVAQKRSNGIDHRRSPDSRAGWFNGVLWAAQFLLAGFLVMGAIPKLTATPEAAESLAAIAEGRWLTFLGLAEIGGAIGLVIPRMTVYAAAGLAVLMACATVANLTVLATPTVAVLTIGLLAIFLGIAWLRSRWATRSTSKP